MYFTPLCATENEDAAVLDAFLLGRALAEAVNERLGRAVGAALADVSRGNLTPQRLIDDVAEALRAPEAALATVTRQDAELRAELRVLQEDVLQRARDARLSVAAPVGARAPAGEAGSSGAGGSGAQERPPKSLRAAIDELRSEVDLAQRDAAAFKAARSLPPTSADGPSLGAQDHTVTPSQD